MRDYREIAMMAIGANNNDPLGAEAVKAEIVKAVELGKSGINVERKTKVKNIFTEVAYLSVGYKVTYVNEIMAMNTKMFLEDKNIGVGQTTICSDTFTSILLMGDEHIVKYTKMALIFAFKRMDEERANEAGYVPVNGKIGGVEKYIGLEPFMAEIDRHEIMVCPVSVEDEHRIIAEMINADLDDVDNCVRILKDINRIFRMYQEKTIDAAKKLYKIAQNFYMIELRHNSAAELSHNFKGFEAFKEASALETETVKNFSIARDKKGFFMAGADGAMEQTVNRQGEVTKVVFQDIFGSMQFAAATMIEDYINGRAFDDYSEIKPDDEEIAALGLSSGLAKTAEDLYYYIRKPYGVVVSWYSNEVTKANKKYFDGEISNFTHKTICEELKELKNNRIEELSKVARYILKDLTPAEAGKLMFISSIIKNQGKGDLVHDFEAATSQIHLVVAPELYFAYQSANADIDVCGYKLIGDTSNLVEGETITLVEGVANSDLFTASAYTGEMTAKFHNNAWYAVKPITSVKAATFEELDTMSIYIPQYSVINVSKFMTEGIVESVNSFKMMDYIAEKAIGWKLVPTFRHGKKTMHNVVVAQIPYKNDPANIATVPVARYICNSLVMEKTLAGLTFDAPVFAKALPKADGSPSTTLEMRFKLEEENRDMDVELYLANTGETDFEINKDMYATTEREIMDSVPDPLSADAAYVDVEEEDSLYKNDFDMDEDVLDMFNDLM